MARKARGGRPISHVAVGGHGGGGCALLNENFDNNLPPLATVFSNDI